MQHKYQATTYQLEHKKSFCHPSDKKKAVQGRGKKCQKYIKDVQLSNNYGKTKTINLIKVKNGKE